MQQPNVGERVWIVDHPDVPENWRCAWGRVAVRSVGQTPRVTVIDVMGRSVELDIDYVRAAGS
jgi:hypothetical protein